MNFLISWIFGFITADIIAFNYLFNGHHCQEQKIMMLMFLAIQLFMFILALKCKKEADNMETFISNYKESDETLVVYPTLTLFWYSYYFAIVECLCFSYFILEKWLRHID